ncbi:g6555 [Coccomyxa viridis]|uniref:G6555 protein n=1 Tax=Coccomyxa viridis TaxID=1274662 RepID=A0ABP1G278_9CHLO
MSKPQESKAAGLPGPFADFFSPTQPDPVLFPRKALDQVFAVLLMRSAYEAVDDLNFIPMDRFQASFWKLRQSEYEPYLLQRSPLRTKQGDLTDPSYFDFISFAQMATVSREIPKGQQEFEEFCEDCDGRTKLVTRAPELRSNDSLPAAFERAAGERIYDGLRNGFRGQEFGAPAPLEPRTPIQDIAKNAQQILDIFTANGYALKASIQDVVPSRSCASTEWHGACPSAGTFRVRLEGPATLWGVAALKSRRAIANAYDAMTLDAYFRSCGCSASYSIRCSDTSIDEFWTIS